MGTLSVVDVSRRFGSFAALEAVSVDAQQGEFLTLLGPSGCGKSTLLNIIAGLDHPTSGKILIDDVDVSQTLARDRDIAMIFQSYALYPNMSVRNNIAFSLKMRKVPKAERDQAVAQVAEMLHIAQLLDRKPYQLSGGQRQRVAMGRALVRNPKLFLFDEPLSNLDAQLRLEMRVEIKRLHQKLGATIVYVTHDQVEAMTLSTKIVVMNAGRIVQCGTPAEIYDRPGSLFVARFVGSPPMNLISGTVVAGTAGPALELRSATVPLPSSTAVKDGQKVTLGIRPESVHLGGERPGHISFDASVEVLEPTGSDLLVLLNSAGGDITARFAPGTRLGLGERIAVSVEQKGLHLFDTQSDRRIN